jgi:hypothetical protein
VPSTINARPGGYTVATVYALRHDGFAGEIALALKDPPTGFVLSGARIPAGQDHVQVTLGVPRSSTEHITTLQLVGAATIGEEVHRHAAVPADDMMQAFAYHHLVPAQELLVDVVGRPPIPIEPTTRHVVRLSPGKNTIVAYRVQAPRATATVSAELSESPEGVTVAATSLVDRTIEITFACDAAKAKVGATGNLILTLYAERPNPNSAKNQPKLQRFPVGITPALPFEVAAPAAP